MNKRQLLRATALAASSLLSAEPPARSFPPRNRRLVVGFAAGGATRPRA